MQNIGNFIGKRRSLVLALTFITCLLFTAGILHQGLYFDLDPQKFLHTSTPEVPIKPKAHHVLLPAGYEFTKGTLDKHLLDTSAHSWKRTQLATSEVMDQPLVELGQLKSADLMLYEASKDNDCGVKKLQFKIFVQESHVLPFDMTRFFKIFQEEAYVYRNAYYLHVANVFEDYITEDHFSKNWYAFAGSSVWLKAYNVHLVLSRLVFSAVGSPQGSRLSMVFAQIFDENWDEIEDVRLVFPTNDVGNPLTFQEDGQTFILYRFPGVLPAPALIGKHTEHGGAEDPRMFLTRNEAGHEEPVIIFNALQKKEIVKHNKTEIRTLRTMFISFPFQTQQGKGKYITEEGTEEQWFLRTKQIKIAGKQEASKEKNWSPFVSNEPKYKEHLYLSTLLVPLEIIKCDLWTDTEDCQVMFLEQGGLGALRGGTPFFELMQFEEKDKDIFIGVGRSHLKNCGCGQGFYRPHIIVMLRNKDQWMISHVSSVIDLGIDIITNLKSGNVCENINAVIPNGIERWDFERDVLTIFISNSDLTLERVTIRGIMKNLNQMEYWKTEKDENTVGPVRCAMEASKQFCKDYAKGLAAKSASKIPMSALGTETLTKI